jgi:hypothetical protein
VFETVNRGGTHAVALFEGIAEGETVTAPLTSTTNLNERALGLPRGTTLVHWKELLPPSACGMPPRYALFARDALPISIDAGEAVLEERTWRVAEVNAPRTGPGFLGATFVATPKGLRVSSITSPSPAAGTWLLRGGQDIESLAGLPVHTADDVLRALTYVGPGGMMRVAAADAWRSDGEVLLWPLPKGPPPVLVEGGK